MPRRKCFAARPSPHSDQYSLAIVYQEMLTGTLPFAGGNAAELTLQHLNDEPELSALSSSDRYAVSRALAKDSQHRYNNCRDFIDALFKATSSPSDLRNRPMRRRRRTTHLAPHASRPVKTWRRICLKMIRAGSRARNKC